MSRFLSLYVLSNEKAIAKKVLKPVATRWLSIYYCIVRILRLWPILKKYFEIECSELDHHSQSVQTVQESSPQDLYNYFTDPIMLMYQLYLEWVLGKLVKFNEKLQSNKLLAPVKYELVVELYKFFLKIFMDPDFIAETDAEIINPCDYNYFLPEEDIYLPPKIKDFIEAHADNSDMEENEEIMNVIRNCKMFAREAAMKIQERFQIENTDMSSLLSFLQPQNALSRVFHENMPNLNQIFTKFKTLVPDNANTLIINEEWKNLLQKEFDGRIHLKSGGSRIPMSPIILG